MHRRTRSGSGQEGALVWGGRTRHPPDYAERKSRPWPKEPDESWQSTALERTLRNSEWRKVPKQKITACYWDWMIQFRAASCFPVEKTLGKMQDVEELGSRKVECVGQKPSVCVWDAVANKMRYLKFCLDKEHVHSWGGSFFSSWRLTWPWHHSWCSQMWYQVFL